MANEPSPHVDLNDVTRFVVSGKSGDTIFREGDTGSEMFIIQEGEIEIVRVFGPSTVRLALLGIGDFFGEMSLLEEVPREGSARAVTDYRLLKIDHSTFDQMVQETPEIPIRMLRKLSRRLREQQEAELRATRIAREVLGEARVEAPRQEAESSARPPLAAMLIHEPSGTEFPLADKPEFVIGRVDRATGIVPDIDFTELDTDRTLSRRHAKISRAEDGFYLREEIGTGNGTFVNGERLKTGAPIKLEDGDEVRLGLVRTVFRRR